jgi:hypothetical protein
MEWNRSETLVLASAKCKHCKGTGLRQLLEGPPEPCNCVLRTIFRGCFRRFVECACTVSLELAVTQQAGAGWSRKNEEYLADFALIMRRVLTQEEQKLFRYHYLLGADSALCSKKLGIEKGVFFHTLYRIQHKLGRALRETEPYALFPTDEYFTPMMRDRTYSKVIPMKPMGRALTAEQVPLKRAA